MSGASWQRLPFGLAAAGLLVFLLQSAAIADPSGGARAQGCRQATVGDLERVEERTEEDWVRSARFPQFRLVVSKRSGKTATLRVRARSGNTKRNPKAGEDFRYAQMAVGAHCPGYMWLLREVKKRGCWLTGRVPGTGRPGYVCQTKWWPARNGNGCEPGEEGTYSCWGRWRKVRLGKPIEVRVPPGGKLRMRVHVELPASSRPGTGVPVWVLPGRCLCQFNGNLFSGSKATNDVLLR